MGCNCFTAVNLKTEESDQSNEIVSTTTQYHQLTRRLFTVREENFETSETRSVSRID